MTVGDATGTAEAVCWDDAEIRYALCGTGTPVHVSGIFETSERWGVEDQDHRAARRRGRRVRDGRPGDGSDVSVERLEADLRDLLETVQNPELRELLDLFFAPDSENWERFRNAPAAKTYHQAYRHGLLEHTLSVAQAVSAAANFFPGIDREIAVTGALLHDNGKLIAYNDDPLAIDLTDAGRLQGEIPLGYYTVRRAIEDIPGFDPRLAQCVLHIILSHHGQLEHGSPVVPATREAVLVHMIDNLGGRLGSFDRLERQLPEGESGPASTAPSPAPPGSPSAPPSDRPPSAGQTISPVERRARARTPPAARRGPSPPSCRPSSGCGGGSGSRHRRGVRGR